MQPELDLGNQREATKAASLGPEELGRRLELMEAELVRVLKELYELRDLKVTDDQLKLLIEEQLASQRAAEFGASSERYKKPGKKPEENGPPPPRQPRVKRPSERYPDLPIREQVIRQDPAPGCPCCGLLMTESGMMEESEQLTVIPKKFEIVKTLRAKYRCSCQGAIVTVAAAPRIIPGSSYSDEMIVDVALSKYCDLIPIERYVAMASRGGVKKLPPQSLIETSHGLADYLSPAYWAVQRGVFTERVLNADETPHRMLEGSDTKHWYLWGFSTPRHCFFECHDTRSGDVASQVLLKSRAEVLVTDVFSGYAKAIRQANTRRLSRGLPLIMSANCNSHGRRYFHRCWPKYQEASFYLDHYHEIYQLDQLSRGQPPPRVLALRARMRPMFEAMRARAFDELPRYPEQGKYAKALRYFLDNYDGLTLFLSDADVPIDNNSQERLLRSHVVGRKTWYGTHSERGALTAAVLFTLVESCKLNHVNPRQYFASLVESLHAGLPVMTPYEFKQALQTQVK